MIDAGIRQQTGEVSLGETSMKLGQKVCKM